MRYTANSYKPCCRKNVIPCAPSPVVPHTSANSPTSSLRLRTRSTNCSRGQLPPGPERQSGRGTTPSLMLMRTKLLLGSVRPQVSRSKVIRPPIGRTVDMRQTRSVAMWVTGRCGSYFGSGKMFRVVSMGAMSPSCTLHVRRFQDQRAAWF